MAGKDVQASHPEERLNLSARLKRLSDRTPLRTKLITAVLALVITALAAISTASVVMLHGYVTTQHDDQLTSALNAVNQSGKSPFPGAAQPFALSEIIVAVQLPGKQVSWLATGSPDYGGPAYNAPLPRLPTATDWTGSAGARFITSPAQTGPDSWRVLGEATTYPTATGYASGTLIVAVPLGNVNAMTTRLVLFDLAVGGAIVVVLAVIAIGLVRANLRPLDDIELTAGQIAAGHLEHRVPEGNPRTEIGSLSRSLNAMLAHVERAFHAQEEAEQSAHHSEERMRRFIADAAHELRTPLTTIRGFAAHYRQRGGASRLRPEPPAQEPHAPGAQANGSAGVDGLSPGELDHLMGRVESEAARMGMLVEDLLTLARLDQQRPMNRAPVDLLTLAADAVQDARIVSPGRPIDLVVAPGTAFLIDGDEARLRQVLANLVNNALTHTPAGTPVRVKLAGGTLEAGTAPAVVVDVEDDGPGMPAEQAQRVFERFYRADAARNRASGGTGLGLAIVAGLVAAHGGTVSLRTAPGQGSDFQVKLPLSPDALPLDDADADSDADADADSVDGLAD